MFSPIRASESAADKCAEAIRRRILGGELAPGERLPPERALAESLGVNRVTLRTALAELRAAGLVKVRQGSGYTVERFEDTGGPALLPALVRLSSDSPARRVAICADLLLLRRHLAAAALTKLAGGPLDPAPITAAVDRFVALATSGASPEALALADIDVVAAVLDATGSLPFRLILNPLSRALDEFPELLAVIYKRPAENAAAYQALLSWLERPDPAFIGALLTVLEARDRASITDLEAAIS